ncbi:MAG: S24/S26 family peptidase [Clostridium sp.]|nr:S24/S26 family peptidase [Clostridium sp.]
MSMLKQIVKSVLRVLLAPLRLWKHRRGEVPRHAVRKMPNDKFLTEVRRALQEGHTATIVVKGYSMRPFLEHCRDKVVLQAEPDPQPGDAVLAEIAPGRFVLHRIIRREGNRLTLMGDGNLKGVERCRVDDVAGKVITYLYPSHQMSADDARLCRRIRIWRRLKPVRRGLLFVYRILNE